ncbi:carbon-nitrogen hydrolase family protein [Thermus filiformis]|uniref:Hydrolase n=1 Tax=Thermus filiformis TaxID=276 RepID=A0A0A2WVJ4_THEFI|nr:carbon-nitrogen hydrolase family protein [Thermus filiformis]KGQ22807.1 hydrolase [Thermus filiformis]
MRVGLAHLALTEPAETLKRALRLLEEARAEGVDLVLFPEYLFGRAPFPEGVRALAEAARALGVRAALGHLEAGQNRLSLLPGGPSYAKLHPYLDEPEVTPGQAPVLWEGFGLALCYDLDFPELFRSYALKGAEAFLVGAAWPGEYRDLMEVLARARAAENQAYLFLANRHDTGSPSLAVRPDGRVVLRLEAEGLGVAELDRGFLEAYRAQYPILSHRRAAY